MLFEGGGCLNLGFILMNYFPKSEIYVAYKENKISPELKAQLSFSVWLFVRHLKRGTSKGYSSLLIWSRQFKIFIFFTTRPISTKLSTKHLWVKRIQVCSNEGSLPFPRRDNNDFKATCLYIHNFAQVSSFVRNVSPLSDVAPESLVYWPLSILKQHVYLFFHFLFV